MGSPADPRPVSAPRAGRLARAATAVCLGVLACAAVVIGLTWWSVTSERGSAWLLDRLPGVKVEGVSGALLGEFQARRVVVELPGQDSMTITALHWTKPVLAWTHNSLWFSVRVDTLHADRIDVSLKSSGEPASMAAPTTLRWPVDTQVTTLSVGELHVSALGDEPVRDIQASVHLSSGEGAQHRVDALALRWDRLQLRGSARVATSAPLSLTASLGLAQAASTAMGAWSAAVALSGPLVAPQADAHLRASPSRGHAAAQALDVHALLRPFDAWPLAELQASTTALDLSAFSPSAPQTALTGRAVVSPSTGTKSAQITLDIHNEQAGLWSDAGLPLRSLRAEATGRLGSSPSLALTRFDADLGTQRASAGRVSGQGDWSNDRWKVDASLLSLRPDALDVRGPAMQVSGSCTLSGRTASPLEIDVQADLRGQSAQPAQATGASAPVQLRLDASMSAQRIDVRALQAVAAGAQAQFAGTLSTPQDGSAMSLKAQGSLVEFDPRAWWPGKQESPWRRANHRLNAKATADLTLPRSNTGRSPSEWLAGLRGQADISIDKSILAGVALSGHASLHGSAGAPAQVMATLNADGNELTAKASVEVAGSGAGDVWDVTLQAPSLERIQPILQLLPAWGGEVAISGSAHGNAHLSGRWPSMTTQGQLEATDLQLASARLARGQAAWSLGTASSAPLSAQVSVSQLRVTAGAASTSTIDALTLQLQGTARAHILSVRAELAAAPAPWMKSLAPPEPATAAPAAVGAVPPAASAQSGRATAASLRVHGGLDVSAAGESAGWSGAIESLDVGDNGVTWAHASGVDVQATWAGPTTRLEIQPGHADVLGAALRWSQLVWAHGNESGRPAAVSGTITMDPMAVAPVLSRLQPDFGWSGDLMVDARLELGAPSGPVAGFAARASIARVRGDLSVTDELGTRALGLSELAAELVAQHGVWTIHQRITGKSVGVLSASAVIHASESEVWPNAAAPLEGSIALDVADLGSWGDWLPPGWRIAGTLQAYASLGGRFGTPEYTGGVVGKQLSVRNFLLGVDATDGELAVRLDGHSAHIDRFTAKAGKGTATIQGTVDLGRAPSSTLQLSAKSFQLLGRVDRRIVASGQAQLSIDPRSIGLNGRFTVDEGLIDFTRSDAPGLSDDVRVVRGPAPTQANAGINPAAAPTVSPATAGRSVLLDLNVNLGEHLRLRGRGLDTRLSGDLHITSPGGHLAVNGTVRTIDGTYAAYNQKLSVDRGAITFSGALDNPRLDIEATRPNIDTRVGVQITGSAANPRVRLFSEPELSDIDKLSWLVLGRASDGLGSTDTALLQHAALALLAGEGGGLTDQLTKAIGLDDVSVRQQTDGTVQETVVSLGKQISQRWYVGYEHGLNATAGGFQLIYRIAQRFTLRMQSGTDNSVDLIWSWRWH